MFEIIIRETKDVVKTVGRNWEVIGQNEPAGEKYAPTSVYGYTPEIEKTVTETKEIYKQLVDELDLKNVIRAINGSLLC